MIDIDTLERFVAVVVAILVYLEFEYFTKDHDATNSQKALYTIIDAIHVAIMLSVIYLGFLIVVQKKFCNNLILLNALWFLIVYLFLHFKRCILTIMSADALGSDVLFSDPRKRLKLLLGMMTPKEYEISHYNDPEDPETPTEKWMRGNKLPVGIVFLINMFSFYRLNK